MNNDKYKRLIETAERSFALKDAKRAGWVKENIPDPESVADHSFGTALLIILYFSIFNTPLNREKCLMFALLHDLPEAMTGDIAIGQGIEKTEKIRREKEAIKVLAQTLDSEEISNLWNEYESQESEEARLVKDFNKIENVIQERYYNIKYVRENPNRFLEIMNDQLQTEAGKEMLEAMKH